MQSDVEPFIEIPDIRAIGNAVSVGYRSAQTGAILATVEIPSALLADTIPLQASAHLTFDGTIIARAQVSGFCRGIPDNGFTEVSLAELAEQILSTDNLRMDQIGQRELTRLLEELEKLAQRVRTVIANL